jgi:hypothetical protein
MKKYLAILLLCLSCTPVFSIRATDKATIIANKSGSFSCLRSSCCAFYKHHRDVEKAAAMLCMDEKVSAKQISEGGFPLTEIDLNFRVIYDDSKLIH